MLAIARALMMQPKLLILDEPTLGLAPVILEQLSKALEPLRQTTDITVLLGEQNVTFALPHADRVYRAGACPHRLGGRSPALRPRDGHRLSLSAGPRPANAAPQQKSRFPPSPGIAASDQRPALPARAEPSGRRRGFPLSAGHARHVSTLT